MKCCHPLCPRTWVKKRIYVIGERRDEWYVMNSSLSVLPFVSCPRSVAAKHKKAKQSVTGALNVIRNLVFTVLTFFLKNYLEAASGALFPVSLHQSARNGFPVSAAGTDIRFHYSMIWE